MWIWGLTVPAGVCHPGRLAMRSSPQSPGSVCSRAAPSCPGGRGSYGCPPGDLVLGGAFPLIGQVFVARSVVRAAQKAGWRAQGGRPVARSCLCSSGRCLGARPASFPQWGSPPREARCRVCPRAARVVQRAVLIRRRLPTGERPYFEPRLGRSPRGLPWALYRLRRSNRRQSVESSTDSG